MYFVYSIDFCSAFGPMLLLWLWFSDTLYINVIYNMSPFGLQSTAIVYLRCVYI